MIGWLNSLVCGLLILHHVVKHVCNVSQIGILVVYYSFVAGLKHVIELFAKVYVF